AALALTASAVFASGSQALWLFLPLSVVAVPSRTAHLAAAFFTGVFLGLSPVYGICHLAFTALVFSRRGNRWAVAAGLVLAVGPFALVASALAYTGWIEEASRAVAMGSAVSLGILVAAWARHFTPPRLPAALAVVALILVAWVGPLPARQWPAYLDLESSDDPTAAQLLALLQRGAAGDLAAANAAVGLWVRDFDADLPTVRQHCPKLGWISLGGESPLSVLGADACHAVKLLPEHALNATAGIRFRSELLAETGVVDENAPDWLLQITGRTPLVYGDWDEFNRQLDFEWPRPPRVRGLRGQGAGTMRTSYATDLNSFTLTTVTKTGGTGYSVDVPLPPQPLRALVFRGVSRRGLLLEAKLANGDAVLWGCGVSGESNPPMPESI
ncbi:MAG: hypothetical protein AAFX94_22225, partial [Myxococcota bacterium]